VSQNALYMSTRINKNLFVSSVFAHAWLVSMPLTVSLVWMAFLSMALVAVDLMAVPLAVIQYNPFSQSTVHSPPISPHAAPAFRTVPLAALIPSALHAQKTFTCTARVVSTIVHLGQHPSGNSENAYSASTHALSAQAHLPIALNAASCYWTHRWSSVHKTVSLGVYA
jgi:hypothetical protein